jgi:hypothetical protein
MPPPAIRPLTLSAPDRYCRLFPPSETPFTEELDQRLKQLASSMASNETPIPPEKRPLKGRLPAGYTYFGQFIDHDLTYDDTPSPHAPAEIDPTTIKNRRTEFLNLQTLYGDGPSSPASRSLYAADGISFRRGARLPNDCAFDVPLADNGKPQVADPRNVENTIVRQLTAMFLQLHNMAVEEIAAEGSHASPQQRFTRARERVCHQYQWLVRYDFLPRICDSRTAAMVLRGEARFIDWDPGQFSIPVEFAQAAFRFGHSAVKHKYRLRDNRQVGLAELFGGHGSVGPLSASDAVDWAEFLNAGGNRQFAHLIDTAIVRDLFRVPERSSATFAPAAERDRASEGMLPLRTLRRGAASRLCSGQVAKRCLCAGETGQRADVAATQRDRAVYGFEEATQLWYYILLEAELHESGKRLGAVGSRIVAGTIEGALHANRASFVHEAPGWRPKPWRARDGSEIQVETLYDLARVVGLA